MSYVKTQWVNGDTITADKLNHIEAGIEANETENSLVKSHLGAVEIVDTASGAIATFADGSDSIPVESLTVTMEPIQDLHGQDAPYPAGGGKNLFQTTAESKTEAGVTWTVNADGSVSVSGTSTGYTSLVLGIMPVDSSLGVITISGIASASNITWGNLSLYDSNGDLVYTISGGSSQASFTVDLASYPTATQLRVMVKRNNDAAVSGVIKPQVEKGSSATTFAPYSNICPISGRQSVTVWRSGGNIWNEEWDTGDIDGHTGEFKTGNYIRSKNLIPVSPETSYYIKIPSQIYLYEYDASKNAILTGGVAYRAVTQSRVYTVSANTKYIAFREKVGGEYGDNIAINYPSTVTDYNPSVPLTIPLGQTVYGGTVDVVSGEMVVDRAMVDLGDLTWTYSTSYNGYFASSGIVNNVANSPECVCSMYRNLWGGSGVISGNDNIIFVNIGQSGSAIAGAIGKKAIIATDRRYSDADTFKTAVTGQQLVYKLATPLTIQLVGQPITTLKGLNNVWSDGGDVSVDYVADTKLYIEQLTEPDADMVADANITSGQYFMVGNNLYLATANIASGAAITPGVNCTRTSLAEALNAINA